MCEKLKKATVFLLLFVSIYTLLVTVALGAREDDYSKPGAAEKTTLNSAEILSLVIDGELSDAERAYLELYGEYKITYGSYIPTSFVEISYNAETGTVRIIAQSYAYVAENGAEVLFLPKTAEIDGRNVDFEESDGEFIAELNVGVIDENEKARVKYKTEFEISESIINSLASKAYNDARYWKEYILQKETEYKAAIAEYKQRKALYDAYLIEAAEYEDELLLYEAYCSDKIAYNIRLAAYNRYLLELSDYEAELLLYNEYEKAVLEYNENYIAYKEYLKAKESYPEALAKYNKYVNDITAVRAQLAIIDGLKNYSTSLKRSVYNAIRGNTVTEVIDNKDAIANSTVGIKPETVDRAGEATENLRNLFKGYYALEEESDKYAYYLINYEGFKSNFISLFTSLDKMYTNSKVRLALKEKGIQEKYEILLAQLYYVVNAISDSPVYNYDGTAVYGSSYTVNSVTKITALKLLDNIPYMTDTNNAAPLTTGYPEEVKKPVLIEVKEPVRPTQVALPIAPDEVESPGEAPTEVEHPGERPQAVKNPGDEPVSYSAPDVIVNLISAYDSGELGSAPREEAIGSKKIEAEITVNKQIGNAQTFRVDFFGTDGRLLHTTYADKGTYAEYVGTLPEKEEDSAAVYEFIGWMNEQGELCDIRAVESNLSLYPCFEKKRKSYTVTWNIDGAITNDTVLHGEMPTPPQKPGKNDEGSFEYIFKGWDKEITAVTENVTYTAVFEADYIYRSENGTGIHITKDENGFTVDATKTYDEAFDLEKLLTRVTKNDSITLLSKSCRINISSDAISKMKLIGASRISLKTTLLQGGGSYALRVSLYNSDGGELSDKTTRAAFDSNDIKINLSKSLYFEDSDNVILYYTENGERKQVRAVYEAGELSASLVAGRAYYATVEYTINLLPAGSISIEAASVAKKGEFVTVKLSGIPLGTVVDSVYYIDSDGVRNEITEGGFYMCAGGATVGVDYHEKTYKITFIADGKTVATVTAKYGETVPPPPNPVKASDTKYSYTFVDWIPEIAPATADAVYEARYMQEESLPNDTSDGLQITPSVMKTIMLIALVAFYGGLVFAPILIIVLVSSIRRVLRRR